MPGFLNKERVLFLLALLLAVWGLWGAAGYEPPRLRVPRGKTLAPPPAPYVPPALSWPAGGLARVAGRDLFAEPVELKPLPPLTLAPPPLLPPPLPAPPPDPGPAPRFWRGLSHVLPPAPVAASVPGDAAGEAKGGAEETPSPSAPDPAAVYDQVVRKGAAAPLYGRIRNPDPLALAAGEKDGVENHLVLKPGARLEFDHYDPKTGRRRGVSTFTASELEYFALAATDENLYAVKRWRLDPADVEGRLRLARWLRERGRIPWAAREYREVLRRDPKFRAVYLELGLTLEGAFLWEEALDLYASARARGVEDAELLYREARVLLRLRLYGQAEARLRQALTLERGDPRIHLALGLCLRGAGRTEEALVHLEHARAASTPGGRARLARVWAEASVARGEVLLWLGRPDEAERAFAEVRERAAETPAAPRALLGEGAVAYARGGRAGVEKALARWQEGRDGEVGRPFLIHRGYARARLGQFAAARTLLARALRQDPLRADLIQAGLGFVAECEGKLEEAREHYGEAQLANPQRLYPALALGRVLRCEGDLDGAREQLRRALAAAPDAVDVLLELGALELAAEKPQDALRYLERARSLAPDLPAASALLGAALLRAGREEEALRWAEGVLGREAEDPWALAHAAVLYYRRGEVARALGHLEACAQAGARHKRYAALVRYARETAAAIRENEARRVWEDDFNRAEIKRGWEVERHPGLDVRLVQGRVRLGGEQQRGGEAAALRRRVNLGELERFEAELKPAGGMGARCGLEILVRLRGRGGRAVLRAGLQFALLGQGRLGYRVFRDGRYEDWHGLDRTVDTAAGVRLACQRADPLGQRWHLRVNGDMVARDVTVPGFRGWNRDAFVGIFGTARIGVAWQVTADDVRLLLQLKEKR